MSETGYVSPLAQIKKAIGAAGIAVVGAIGVALADGSLNVGELAISVSAGLAAFVATYNLSNDDQPSGDFGL